MIFERRSDSLRSIDTESWSLFRPRCSCPRLSCFTSCCLVAKHYDGDRLLVRFLFQFLSRGAGDFLLFLEYHGGTKISRRRRSCCVPRFRSAWELWITHMNIGCLCPGSSVSYHWLTAQVPVGCLVGENLASFTRMIYLWVNCDLTKGPEVKNSTSFAYVSFVSSISVVFPDWQVQSEAKTTLGHNLGHGTKWFYRVCNLEHIMALHATLGLEFSILVLCLLSKNQVTCWNPGELQGHFKKVASP